MNRQLAGALTGRVTKWIVLVVWLLVAAGSASFAAKLADVQNNEASSWLPESAESTRAFEKLEPFQDPNAIPTLVVYERDGGLTRGRPRGHRGARRRVRRDGRPGRGQGGPSAVGRQPGHRRAVGFPAVSEDGEVAQTR